MISNNKQSNHLDSETWNEAIFFQGFCNKISIQGINTKNSEREGCHE